MLNRNNSIALYGPTSAGKTSLLRAFLYAISRYASNHSDGRMDIELSLGKTLESLRPVRLSDCFLDNIDPSTEAVTDAFRLRRVPTNLTDDRANFSSFIHEGGWRDNQGIRHTELIADKVDDPGAVRTTHKSLETATGIIAVLDPTRIDSATGRITREDYSDMMRYLTNLDASPEGIKRRIAICVSKIDLMKNFSDMTAESYIDQLFLDLMTETITKLKKKFVVKCFLTSNYGFLPSGQPNSTQLDSGKYGYIDRESWKPYKVIDPFFWIFQSIEVDLIKQEAKDRKLLNRMMYSDDDYLKKYIPYDSDLR